MTIRLTMHCVDGSIIVEEFPGIMRAMNYVEHGAFIPTLIVIQELDAPVESTWGQVKVGDEVLAPDGSLWWVDTMIDDDTPRPVGLTSLDGKRTLAFNVTPDMPIMRRPGVLSAAAQLLHDVGLWSGR